MLLKIKSKNKKTLEFVVLVLVLGTFLSRKLFSFYFGWTEALIKMDKVFLYNEIEYMSFPLFFKFKNSITLLHFFSA